MIKNLEIENFRGISKGKIAGFLQLNIFIGKNNIGKSTILEALVTVLNYEMLQHIVKRRGWHGFDSVLSIFRFKNADKPVKISTNNINIEIEKGIPHIEESKYLISSHGFSRDIIVLTTKIKKSTGVIILKNYFDSNGNYHGIYYQHELKKNHKENVIFIDNQCIYGKTPTEAYNMIFEQGYKAHERLMEVINTVYPDIKDIRIFSEKVGLEIVYKHGKVPFFAMGDGFKSAYVYLAYLISVKNGYILCEEPENYQHPSSRKLIVKGICNSAKDNQIFISTHSIELIDEILDECEDINIKFFVPSIDENGILKHYSFDKEEAEFRRRELEADLRG